MARQYIEATGATVIEAIGNLESKHGINAGEIQVLTKPMNVEKTEWKAYTYAEVGEDTGSGEVDGSSDQK